MNFENKNIVITGGSTGIGFATAKAFIEKGVNVWITGRIADNLQKAAAKIDSQRLKTAVSDTSNLVGIAVLEKSSYGKWYSNRRSFYKCRNSRIQLH